MSRRILNWFFLGVVLAALAQAGCAGTAQNPQAQPGAVGPEQQIPQILRNTVGAETRTRGLSPTLVSGFGLVVGLNGTGSADIPPAARGYMEREMRLRGVGAETRGMGETSPHELLNDPNTAVVYVQAAIPPGSPEGARFDVLVTAVPGTSTTSLEGGRLWTTELFRGRFRPGGSNSQPIARAKGDIFINPFSDADGESSADVVRTTGRILNGGVAVEPSEVVLTLNNPSHARARTIASAINTQFPHGAEDREPAAKGVNEEVIRLNPPKRFHGDTTEFLQLVLHTRIDQRFPEEWALRYTRALKNQPEMATGLSWALQALGEHAKPHLRKLYDHPEMTPRLAALRAGAGLGDPLAGPHLRELATEGPPALRTRAIALLGELESNPDINLALREMLDAEEMDVRIAAYEALAERFDPALDRQTVENKFILDVAPSEEPMVYVTQQGRPRIVVFGSDLSIERPTFVSAWSDRLMLTAQSPSDPLRIYHQDERTGEPIQATVDPALPKVIEFLAHEQTPESPAPGLGLPYSKVVGALHEIWKDGGFPGSFVTERDRLAAELLRSLSATQAGQRAETSADQGDEGEAPVPDILGESGRAETEEGTNRAESPISEQARRYVVPLKKDESPKNDQ